MKILTVLVFLSALYGCDTPYTGHIGPNNFNGWITEEGEDFICLANGFDTLCIKAIPGETGKEGKQGKQGKTGIEGKDGKDGNDGKDGINVNLDDVVAAVIEHLVITEQIEEVSIPIVSAEVAKAIGTDTDVSTKTFTDIVIDTIEETGVGTYNVPVKDVIQTVNDALETPSPTSVVVPVVNPMHETSNPSQVDVNPKPPVPSKKKQPIVTCETDPNDNAHCAPDPIQAAKNREEYKFEDPDQGYVAYKYTDKATGLTFSGTIPENAVKETEDGTLVSTVDGSLIAEDARIVTGETEDEAWANLD